MDAEMLRLDGLYPLSRDGGAEDRDQTQGKCKRAVFKGQRGCLPFCLTGRAGTGSGAPRCISGKDTWGRFMCQFYDALDCVAIL